MNFSWDIKAYDIYAGSIFALSFLAVWSLFSFISLIFYQTDKRQAIAKIWLSIASLLLVYPIVDLCAGFFLIPRLSPRMIPDQFVHHKLAPKTHSKIESREYSYIQRINTIGLRGPNVQWRKPRDTYRILMLGDSFTEGTGVSDDHTFSVLLDESLNSSAIGNGKNVQVLNAGVSSYSPILSFLQLKKTTGRLEPDLVVLNLDNSDLIQEVAYRNEATYGADGEIIGIDARGGRFMQIKTEQKRLARKRAKKKGRVVAIRNWVDNNLFMTRLIIFYFDKWTGDSTEFTVRNTVILAKAPTLRHTLSEDTADRTEQWQNIFDSILKIKRYCNDADIDFLLTIYPWGHQVNEREWASGRRQFIPDGALVSDKSVDIIERFAATNNIDILNAFPAFRSYNGKSPLYFKYDMHWTRAGHNVMAQELERFIEATYFSDSN